jgi:hypothetical protein
MVALAVIEIVAEEPAGLVGALPHSAQGVRHADHDNHVFLPA